jgi:hypothetical protein
MVRARTVPVWLTTSSPTVAELPISATRPPLACSVPLFSTDALVAMASELMTMLVRPSPARSSVILRPEASATVPPSAVMLPALLTAAPISTTGPPLVVVILPSVAHRFRVVIGAFEGEIRGAVHEALVAGRQGQRGGDQPAHVHRRALAEHHAVGVDQDDSPVGIELAGDGRQLVARHAVEQHAARARLRDGHHAADDRSRTSASWRCRAGTVG